MTKETFEWNGLNWSVEGETENGAALKSLTEKLVDKVYQSLHWGASVTMIGKDGWPHIFIEDPDTQESIPICINGKYRL
jgi:hypothetical protein